MQKVLHTGDTPHAIALGTGIAMLVAFLPLIGLQTVIAISLAALFRANKAICLPVVWITNPFTMVPIYGACFGLGRLLLPAPGGHSETALLAILKQPDGAGVFEVAFWTGLLSRLAGLGLELWVGCFVVGIVFAIASYFFARRGVTGYRERRRRRILLRSLHRPGAQPSTVTRRNEPA